MLIAILSFGKINAQTIPNAGFETWTNSYTAPSWNSVSILTAHSMAQSTDAHSGTYAVKLATQSFVGQTIPGICALGTISLTTQAVSGGIPFTFKPTNLKGYYKYTPVGGVSMLIAVILTRTTGGVKDTIGGCILQNSNTVSTYTQFSLPIDYNTGVTGNPDTLNIVLLSSASATAGVGSILMVDDLSFEYLTPGVKENSAINYNVYPNPATDNIYITTNDTKKVPVTIKIYDLTGQEVYSENYINENDHTINVSKFKQGMYFVKISSERYNKTEKLHISKN